MLIAKDRQASAPDPMAEPPEAKLAATH